MEANARTSTKVKAVKPPKFCTRRRRRPGPPKIREAEKAVPDATGFERNLKPEKIIGAADFQGKMYFIMKWEGLEDELDIVCGEKAKIMCPQKVIEFYQSNLTWDGVNADGSGRAGDHRRD